MATDFSGNDTPKNATKAGLLSLGSKGKVDDITFGNVGGAGDTLDYYQYATNKGLRQVKVELDLGSFGSASVLSRGGIAGVTDHIEISGSGAFKGKSIGLEVRLGLDGIVADFTKWSVAASDVQQKMIDEYLATGAADGMLMEKIDFMTTFLNTMLRVYEHDRVDADVNEIVSELKAQLVNPSMQGSDYRAEILEAANGLVDALEGYYDPHYFKIVNGKETEISAGQFENVSAVWNAKGGKPGYLIVEGNSEGSSIFGNEFFGLDYTARISVKAEQQKNAAPAFDPVEIATRLSDHSAPDSFDFQF